MLMTLTKLERCKVKSWSFSLFPVVFGWGTFLANVHIGNKNCEELSGVLLPEQLVPEEEAVPGVATAGLVRGVDARAFGEAMLDKPDALRRDTVKDHQPQPRERTKTRAQRCLLTASEGQADALRRSRTGYG